MYLRVFEKGFNYSEDGEGNRLVYHLSGCGMVCPWCSNPEGMRRDGGEARELSSLLEEILSARPLFFDGGGVTFTGGECTLQADALIPLIRLLREEGISVAIESNAATSDFLRVASLCDCLMVDYKSPSAERLLAVTKGRLSVIENNILTIIANKYLHLRIPLVHGFNDSEEDLYGSLAFFERLPRESFDLELLPYHEYGKEKWARLGRAYTVKDGKISRERLALFENRFREAGIRLLKT